MDPLQNTAGYVPMIRRRAASQVTMIELPPFGIAADFDFGPPPNAKASQAVVLCVDAIYAPYAPVTLTSLLTNAASRDFIVVVLTHRIRPDQIAPFRHLAERHNFPVRLICINSLRLDEVETNSRWTTAVYLPWLAPFIVPATTILYVDSDIIIEGDVAELFACRPNGAILGGVEDGFAGQLRRRSLGLPEEEPFLNTGVMLIDARSWKESRVSQTCFELARTHRSAFRSDQDILNVVAQKRKYPIDEKWNVLTSCHGHHLSDQTTERSGRVGALHFSGEVKPWMSWADPVIQNLYRRYVDDRRTAAGFWIGPGTIKEQLLLAQARDRAGDIASANALRRLAIGSILAHTGQDVLSRPKENLRVSRPDEEVSDLLDREIVKAASPRLGLDPLLSSLTEEPHGLWDGLRASRTIPLSRSNGDVYLPTRYADIKAIAERPDLFSSRQIVVGPNVGAHTSPFPPFTSDPPVHAMHRGLLAPLFSGRHAAEFRAVADRTVEPIIERLVGRSTCDVPSEFSLPFVVVVVGSLIGIPDSEMEPFREEALAFIAAAGKDGTRRNTEAALIDRRLRTLLSRRRASPCDDVASALAGARQGGHAIDDELPAALLRVLLEAGVGTTAGVISFAIRHLADREIRATLNSPTFSWKRAVEEFLRLASPAALARRSTSTSTVGGCPIAGDSAVLLTFAAANRDPDAFAGPHEADLDRRNNRHLAFGTGIHRCLGMHLARILVETGVKRWVGQFPSYGLAGDGEVLWSGGAVRAITRLRVAMDGEHAGSEGCGCDGTRAAAARRSTTDGGTALRPRVDSRPEAPDQARWGRECI